VHFLKPARFRKCTAREKKAWNLDWISTADIERGACRRIEKKQICDLSCYRMLWPYSNQSEEVQQSRGSAIQARGKSMTERSELRVRACSAAVANRAGAVAARFQQKRTATGSDEL